jgi:hypothetical protein
MPQVTQKDVDEWGVDAINLVRRAATDVMSPAVQNLAQQNLHLQQQVQRLKSNEVYEALDRALPDWRETNNDPSFHNWLKTLDPYSATSKQVLLNDAFDRGDVGRVLALFGGYLHEHGEGRQASKMRVRSSERNYGQPTFTRAQVADFYAKSAKGYFANNEKQKLQLEHQIIAAGREGRII